MNKPCSSLNGYDIVRVATPELEKKNDHTDWHVENFTILYKGEILGALSNEHVKDNWRVITVGGEQICPVGDKWNTERTFGEILDWVFDQDPERFRNRSVMVKLKTKMGFTRWLRTDHGYYTTSYHPELFDLKTFPGLSKIAEELKRERYHPCVDSLDTLEIIPVI